MDAPIPNPPVTPKPMTPVMFVRALVGGVLMGLANLVPGISGGTMILVVGLYDELVRCLADVSRLQLTRRNLSLLIVVVVVAAVVVFSLAGAVHFLVSTYRAPMYSLFIGLTLGGLPLLYRMMTPVGPGPLLWGLAGLLLLIGLSLSKPDGPARAAPPSATAPQAGSRAPAYAVDFVGGILGASAMVLPGVSGSYLLLIIDRYEAVLLAVDHSVAFLLSGGTRGDASGFHVLLPLAIGVVLGLMTISNLLKWLLRSHRRSTIGFLSGLLVGSVFGLRPFGGEDSSLDYGLGAVLAASGFAATYMLSRLGGSR